MHDAWSAYAQLLGVRRDTYMRTDMQGASGQDQARARQAAKPHPALDSAGIGGYEGLALRVIDGLTGKHPGQVIVNVRNAGVIGSLAASDVVEAPARVSPAGLEPVPVPDLPGPARALVEQVKEYERATVQAAQDGRRRARGGRAGAAPAGPRHHRGPRAARRLPRTARRDPRLPAITRQSAKLPSAIASFLAVRHSYPRLLGDGSWRWQILTWPGAAAAEGDAAGLRDQLAVFAPGIPVEVAA